MKTNTRLGLAIAFAATIAAPVTFAPTKHTIAFELVFKNIS